MKSEGNEFWIIFYNQIFIIVYLTYILTSQILSVLLGKQKWTFIGLTTSGRTGGEFDKHSDSAYKKATSKTPKSAGFSCSWPKDLKHFDDFKY